MDSLSFSKKSAIEVKLDVLGNSFYGVLNVALNNAAEFTQSSYGENLLEFNQFGINETKLPQIEAMSDTGKFILYECEIYGNMIYPEYVLEGEADNFNSMTISMNGFSTWFGMAKPSVHSLVNNGIKGLDPKKFIEHIDYKGAVYEVQNEHRVNTAKVSEGEYSLIYTDVLRITKINSNLSREEIKELSRKFKLLFSILTAQDFSIENIRLYKNGNTRGQNIYFPEFSSSEVSFANHLKCLCSVGFLFSENLWGTVFKNFFSNDNFNDYWSRLYTIFNNSAGVWEWEIFAHVLLLERHCSDGSTQNKTDKKNLTTLIMEEVNKFVKKNINKNDLSKSISQTIKKYNSEKSSFSNKYQNKISIMSKELQSIVNLSEDDFSYIKKIRDNIAHGRAISLSYDDIQKQNMLKNKLFVILMYFCFSDLGFSEEQIIVCLASSFHDSIRGAHLDQKELDRFLGRAKFYELKQDVDVKRYENHPFLVIRKTENDLYIIDELMSSKTREWTWTPSKDRKNVIDMVKDELSSDESADYLNKVYLTAGNGSEYVFHMAIEIR